VPYTVAPILCPGIQAEYEAPEQADLIVHGDRESPEGAAGRLILKLIESGFLESEAGVCF